MQPYWILATAAVLLVAMCSWTLMRRGSSLHLRWCFFSFGLMALTQGAMILAVALNASVTVLSTLQLILAGLSLQAMYQVSAEVASRGRAERLSNAQLNEEPLVWAPSSAATVRKLSTPRGASGAHTPAPRPAENNSVGAEQVEIGELEQSTLRATAELLLLLGAVTASSEMSSVRATVKKHVSLSRAK